MRCGKQLNKNCFSETDRQTQRTNLALLAEVGGWRNTTWTMGGRYRCRIWEGHVHTDIFKMVNQEPPVQPRELCSMLRGSLAGREVWGRMETGVCMAKSHCCAPTLSQGNTVNQLVQYRTRVFIKKNCF